MLKTVTLNSTLDSSNIRMDVALPLSTSRYLITNITGLGPVKTDVSTSRLANLDGAIVNSTNTGVRNIVIEFDYRRDFSSGTTIWDLRQDLYSVAGPGKEVSIAFSIDGMSSRTITGIVESVESPMFSSETKGQLSILCPFPYFKSATKIENLSHSSNNTINYEGDVLAGVRMQYKTPTSLTGVRFRNSITTGWQNLNIKQAIAANQTVMISTEDRNKYAKLWSGTNLIPGMDDFNWWKLHPGSNVIQLSLTPASGTVAAGTFQLTYDVLHGGF